MGVTIVRARQYGPILRLVIAISILFLIARHIGLQSILLQLKELQVAYLIGAFVLILADSFTRIWNWQQIVMGIGIRTPQMFRKLAACYFAGGLFGTVVPSTLGTDAMRAIFSAYVLGGHVAFYSGLALTLSILGLAAGCCLGLAGVLVVSTHGYPASFLGACSGLFTLVVLGASVLYLVVKYSQGRIVGILRMFGLKWFWFRRIARKFISSLVAFTRQHVRITPIITVAVFNQCVRAMILLLIARSVDIQLPLGVCLVMVPLGSLVEIIPLSIAGFGATQLALVYLLAPFGVSAAEALTISLTYATLFLLTNVVFGGAAFLLSSERLRPLPANA